MVSITSMARQSMAEYSKEAEAEEGCHVGIVGMLVRCSLACVWVACDVNSLDCKILERI